MVVSRNVVRALHHTSPVLASCTYELFADRSRNIVRALHLSSQVALKSLSWLAAVTSYDIARASPVLASCKFVVDRSRNVLRALHLSLQIALESLSWTAVVTWQWRLRNFLDKGSKPRWSKWLQSESRHAQSRAISDASSCRAEVFCVTVQHWFRGIRRHEAVQTRESARTALALADAPGQP